MPTTIYTLPPSEQHSLNNILLLRRMPKFRDDAETLYEIYRYVKSESLRCAKMAPSKTAKANQTLVEFLELYERIKKKEKEYEGTDKDISKGFGNYICFAETRRNKILWRLKQKRISHKNGASER